MGACEEGPLDQRKPLIFTITLRFIPYYNTGVVKAFDEAWQLDRVYCASYFR